MSRARLVLSLIFINAAVFVATAAFLPRSSSFSWKTGVPFSYFINSRDRWDIAWAVLLASALASAGVYILTGNDGNRTKDS